MLVYGAPAAILPASSAPIPRIEPSPRRTAVAPAWPGSSVRRRLGGALVHVRPERHNTVAPPVGGEALGRPEPHRLGVEEGGEEGPGVVVLEPRRGVDEVGERDRVRLREAKVGESGELPVDRVGNLAGDTPRRHPLVEASPQPRHARRRALGAHRLAELVRLDSAEPGDVDRDLHQLLLEKRHAERLAKRPLQQGVEVAHLLLAVAAAQVGVDRTALDRPRPDQRDLDDEVVEDPRTQPRQRRHLGAALDLEHPDRVRPGEHVVDGILLGDRRQLHRLAVALTYEVDHAVERLEHAEPQQVELHEPDRGAVLLVPLEDRAPGSAGPLDRADGDHRPVADHHPPRVDAEVSREALELGGEAHHLRRDAQPAGISPGPGTGWRGGQCWRQRLSRPPPTRSRSRRADSRVPARRRGPPSAGGR